jgi:hypothetical protein
MIDPVSAFAMASAAYNAVKKGIEMGQELGDRWTAQEAVVPVDADRPTFVALVDAEGGDGEALADGWFE